jgi:HK97 family phage prohead protease
MEGGPSVALREGAGTSLLAMIQGAGSSFRTSRAAALQVPAFVDAMKTYSHTIAGFPMRTYRGGEPIETAQVLVSPSSYLPYTSVMARTVENLLFHDRAYWLVVERTWDGFPREVQVMDVEDVSDLTTHSTANQNTQFPPVDPFYYIGTAVPARDVIKFYGDGLGGWLTTGAAAINTAAALEAATLNYSEYPMPVVVLKNTGADLPAATVDALLTAWEDARSNRATAYLNSAIEAKGMGWSARDLALVEARNESAIGIARIANLDPVWVGASVSGTSLTYSNRVDLYRQLLDISLRPVMDMLTHRLSMPDVTPRGHAVRFDTSGFLRGNAADLGALVAQLVPLGHPHGRRGPYRHRHQHARPHTHEPRRNGRLMRTVTTDSTLLLHTRADDGGDIIGTGYGMAVPYGVEIEFDGMRESFAPGAFDTAAVVGKPLAYRHNEPIGVITAATNEADGLYIDFDVVNTSLGRDAATLMRTGSSRGLSVGFAPLESKRTQGKNAIVYTKAALAEVSLTHQPAYSTAGVGSIREDGETMSVETVEDAAPAVVADISAREAIDELRREVRSVVHVPEPVHPLAQFRSYGEYSKAVLEGFESRALFDQVTGDNAGVLPPVWLQQVRGIIDLGRPVITGVGGPQSAGTTGLDINWPYFDGDLTTIVAAQANEKDEVNSVQVSIEKGTASARHLRSRLGHLLPAAPAVAAVLPRRTQPNHGGVLLHGH